MSEISIRKAAPAEYPNVLAFYRKCGYSRGISDVDTVLVALREDVLLGVVRLCPERGVVVLRGMQVLAAYQGQGVGTRLLDHCLPLIEKAECYCIPWADLEHFYSKAGFQRCEPEQAPDFLEDRLRTYLADGLDVILMRTA